MRNGLFRESNALMAALNAPGSVSGKTWLGQTSPQLPKEQAPPMLFLSMTVTFHPSRAKYQAQLTPIIPPPTTTTEPALNAFSLKNQLSSSLRVSQNCINQRLNSVPLWKTLQVPGNLGHPAQFRSSGYRRVRSPVPIQEITRKRLLCELRRHRFVLNGNHGILEAASFASITPP